MIRIRFVDSSINYTTAGKKVPTLEPTSTIFPAYFFVFFCDLEIRLHFASSAFVKSGR